MRFTYELKRRVTTPNGASSVVSGEILDKPEEIPANAFDDGGYVEIHDGLKLRSTVRTNSMDGIEQYLQDVEQSAVMRVLALNDKRPLRPNASDAAAIGKARFDRVPEIAYVALGAGFDDGAGKYQPFNWRDSEVKISMFTNKIQRHLSAFRSGEDHASDSQVHHLAHIMANAAIMLDAIQHGVLIDDRSVARDVTRMYEIVKHTKGD